jgi:hypothetical protein
MNNPLRAATILAAYCLAFLLPAQAEQTGQARRLLAADDSTRRLENFGNSTPVQAILPDNPAR